MKKSFLISLYIFACFIFWLFGVLLGHYYIKSQTMAEPVWGQLAKSQTDNETVEEAVTRLIAEHETNAGAHTGAGEALETHKTQVIVDHPAGSIKADKKTNTEYELFDSALPIITWGAPGNTKIQNVGYSLQLNKAYNVGTSASAESTIPTWNPATFGTKEIVLQALLTRYGTVDTPFYVLCVGSYYTNPTDGFGIKIERTGVTLYIDKGGNRYNATKYVATITGDLLYRVHISPSVGNAYLYIDGILRATLALPDDEYIGDEQPIQMYISQILLASASLRMSELYYSQEM